MERPFAPWPRSPHQPERTVAEGVPKFRGPGSAAATGEADSKRCPALAGPVFRAGGWPNRATRSRSATMGAVAPRALKAIERPAVDQRFQRPRVEQLAGMAVAEVGQASRTVRPLMRASSKAGGMAAPSPRFAHRERPNRHDAHRWGEVEPGRHDGRAASPSLPSAWTVAI